MGYFRKAIVKLYAELKGKALGESMPFKGSIMVGGDTNTTLHIKVALIKFPLI